MTMLVETAVERYRFVCGHSWTADYDVQYVSDDVGATFAFYRLDGVPVLPQLWRQGRQGHPRRAPRQPARTLGQRPAAPAGHDQRGTAPCVGSAPVGGRGAMTTAL